MTPERGPAWRDHAYLARELLTRRRSLLSAATRYKHAWLRTRIKPLGGLRLRVAHEPGDCAVLQAGTGPEVAHAQDRSHQPHPPVQEPA